MPQVELVWEWVGQNGQQLGLLATVATAIVAMSALLHAKRDSTERSRPVVVAALEIAPENETSIQLVVRNYGQTTARDVTVTFDRELEAEERRGQGALHIKNRYSRPVGTLGPGQALRNSWWTGVSDAGQDRLVNMHGTPDEALATVTYAATAAPGRFWRRRKMYSDTFAINVQDFMLETNSVSSTSTRGRLGKLVTATEEEAKALTTLAIDAQDIAHQIQHARQYGRTVIITDQVLDAGQNAEHPTYTEEAGL